MDEKELVIDKRKENKMGVMPVNKLLVTMSLPMMASMLIQALYNIVDSMFVAMLSENALTAVSLAFPIQNFMIAVAVGTGVGVNAYLSKCLGEKEFDKANQAAKTAIFLAAINYIIFLIFGIFGSRAFFLSQTNITDIVNDGTIYLTICTVLSFGVFFQIAFERLLQSTGKTVYNMYMQGLGAIINIILDPIMIFGLFGFPRLGVAGAALATVTGQIIAAIVGFLFNHYKNHEIDINLKGYRPNLSIIKRIYSVGIPSIILSSLSSVMTFGMNKILITFSSTATAVFGVYFKLQSFVFMPVFGLNNGMVPIISYNYGARKKERIMKTFKLSIFYAVGIMFVGFLLFLFFPKELLSVFNASNTMMSIGVSALRIIGISFVFAGFSICTLSMCQALGHGLESLLISGIRQLVVLLPVAYVLSKIGGLNLIWWSFPFAEIIAVSLCVFFLSRIYQKEIKNL